MELYDLISTVGLDSCVEQMDPGDYFLQLSIAENGCLAFEFVEWQGWSGLEPGPQGEPWPQWEDWPQWIQWEPGPTWAQWIQGIPGADGNNWVDGANGSVWYASGTPPVGENDGDYWLDPTTGDIYQSQVPMGWVFLFNIIWPQWVPGNDWADGLQWPQGDPGPQWLQGDPGADGADWAQWPQGIQWVPGADGAQGPQWIQGIQWVPGADGAPWADGADWMLPCNLVQDDFPDELMLIEFFETPGNPWCYVGGANVNYGFYSPTLTNVANLDASVVFDHTWMRIGNVVHVAGRVEVNPTTPTAVTQLGISLPYASDIQGLEGVCGSAACPGIISQSAAILGDAANNRAQMEWISGDTTAQSMYYTFQYYIV